MRAANVFLAGLREPEEADLPFVDERTHRTDNVLDRHRRVHTVLVEEIDAIGVETTQRAVDHVADVVRVAVHARDARLAEPKPELRGDDYAIARAAPELSQRARQQLFILVWPVRFGRVEKRQAQLDGAMDRGNGSALVALFRRAIGLAHPHQAEPDG